MRAALAGWQIGERGLHRTQETGLQDVHPVDCGDIDDPDAHDSVRADLLEKGLAQVRRDELGIIQPAKRAAVSSG